MPIGSDLKRPDTLPRPQFFITRIIGGGGLPDYDFITLPADRSLKTYTHDEDIKGWSEIFNSDYPQLFEPPLFFDMFASMIALAGSPPPSKGLYRWDRSDFSRQVSDSVLALARDIFLSQPLPIMQSPLVGKTIEELVKAAGKGAIFYQVFPHPGVGDVVVWLMLVGGTRIVLSVSEVIGSALSQRLYKDLLKWMGVSPTATRRRKKPTATRRRKKKD